MRRSLRKIDTQEVVQYEDGDQLFTVMSLDEARSRLLDDGLDPARYCFFSWMREGVRYYRVWEDQKVKTGIVQGHAFGQVSGRLKRADAEKLYTVAKRFTPSPESLFSFAIRDGAIEVLHTADDQGPLAVFSLPQVGGNLVLEKGSARRPWTPSQAAHFINVILVRGQAPDVAFAEAASLQ